MSTWQRRSGIMLCYPFDLERLEGDRRFSWNEWPVIVQPKLDGERCRAIINASGEPLLLSSEENPIHSVPHVVRALRALNLRSVELDGELYRHGMSFEEIHSRVGRTKNLHEDHTDIEYHIFDIVDENEVQLKRLSRLLDISEGAAWKWPLKFVPFELAANKDAVLEIYDKLVKDLYEGIIVRHPALYYIRRRSPYIMKFKPKKSDVYEVADVFEEVSKDGVPKGTLGGFILRDEDGNEFGVGTGFTREDREVLWQIREALPGRLCSIEYQNLTDAGVPRFSRFVKLHKEVP